MILVSKMRINITKNSRRLETIFRGDILIFPDREEIIEKVDIPARKLYTKRTIETADKNFPFKEKFIVYNYSEKIFPTSKGETYDWVKRRTL